MKCLATAILFIVNMMGHAQQFQYKSFSTKDGLSGNNANAIVKDNQGFLWIATNNGLNRFDGNAFDVFYNNAGDDRSLASNQIQALCIDKKQQLWVGSVGGISLYRPRQQNFSNYYPDSSTGKCGRWFCALAPDDEGRLWVGTWYELLIFDPAAEKFQRSGWADYAATHRPANANNGRVVILSLAKKAPHELWVLTTCGLYSVHTKTKQFQWYPDARISDYFGCRIEHIDTGGNLWLGTYNVGIICFNARSKTWSSYIPPSTWTSSPGFNRCYGIVPYRGDTLLYAGLDHPALFHAAERRFISHFDKKLPNVVAILRDGDSFWLSGADGLTQMRPVQNQVTQVTPFGPRNYIDKVYPLLHQPGSLVLDRSGKGQTGIWQTESKQFTPFKATNGKQALGQLSGWLQLTDSTAFLSQEETIYSVNLKTFTATPLLLPGKQIAANKWLARNMVQDDSGLIWIRLRGQGIVKYEPSTGKTAFVNFITPAQHRAYGSMYYNRVQQCLWVAVEHEGLYRYHIKTGVTTHYLLPGKNNGTVADIFSITGDAAGNMFMTDVLRGLYYYDNQTQSFTLYTRQHGLPSDNCYLVALDSEGSAWITTAEGLVRMKLKAGGTPDFDYKDLLPTGEFSFLSADAGGNMYLCLDTAYYQWNINRLPQPSKSAAVYLRGIRINNQPVAADSSYRLSFRQNNISFQFGYLLPNSNARVQLEYKLNNDDWIPLGNDNKISFSNLSPNNYKLFVRTKDSAITPLFIRFKIAPPFYKTGWFIFLSACGILLLAFLFVKWREKNIRTIAAEKLKVQQLNAEQYKNKLEVEKIINYFSTSLTGKKNVDDVLWDIAKNLIGRIGFVDCMIYLWNAGKTKMIQKAGFGPKGSAEEISKNHFDVLPGQGVVGYVMQTKEPVLIPDTSTDSRYRPDEMVRLSEITVPVIFNDELIGVIDSEHPEKNFFTSQHLQIMSTIATLMADKIKTIEAEASLQQQQIQMHSMNEQLSNAKLEALRSQMNPHFIFNCISSIDNFILDNDAANASAYLNKFAKLIRNILDNSKNDVVPFWKDWETLRLYTELERLRAGDTFQCRMEADEALLNGHYRIPPLIIQPYVENAIHHGLKHRYDNNGLLTVTARLQGSGLVFTVEDNGIGRKKSAELKVFNNVTHTSYGMQLSGERVQLFNAMPGNVFITDLSDAAGNACGTRVQITLSV